MTKKLGLVGLFVLPVLLLTAMSQGAVDHSHHARHGMILVGTNEIFASHIVYKEPHHFQVLAKLELDQATKVNYLAARQVRPNDLYILVLDPMDLKDIGSAPRLTGKIVRQDELGAKHDLILGVEVPKQNVQVLYFDELPLSLKADE